MTGVNRCGNRLLDGVVSLLIVAGVGPAAWAVLLAYEGFDYTVGGNLAGSGSATSQWTSAWDDVQTGGLSGVTTIQAGSLSYTDTLGNALITTGNSILNTGINGTNSQQGRNLVAGPRQQRCQLAANSTGGSSQHDLHGDATDLAVGDWASCGVGFALK